VNENDRVRGPFGRSQAQPALESRSTIGRWLRGVSELHAGSRRRPTLVFRASVEAQSGACATGVLALILSAALAVTLALWREHQRPASVYFGAMTLVFAYTLADNCVGRPDGVIIGSAFILLVLAEHLGDLGRLHLRLLAHFLRLARPLACVVLGVALGREVAPQTHRDRARRDLRDTGCDDETVRDHDPRQPCSEGIGDGQPVGHPDDDIANGRAAFEMSAPAVGASHPSQISPLPPVQRPARARAACRDVSRALGRSAYRARPVAVTPRALALGPRRLEGAAGPMDALREGASRQSAPQGLILC
jgi:hypothetical protein